MYNVVLDFEITDDQLEMLAIHAKLKNSGVFDGIKCREDIEFDKVQVWFSCQYNDNLYDLDPIYADLILGDKIVQKVVLSTWQELEIREWNLSQYQMMSYTVAKKLI